MESQIKKLLAMKNFNCATIEGIANELTVSEQKVQSALDLLETRKQVQRIPFPNGSIFYKLA